MGEKGNTRLQPDDGQLYVRFAKKLAHNELKVRNKALKMLSKFLSGDFVSELPNVELLRLWKGLFYALWMADKPVLQQEIARTSTHLAFSIVDYSTQFRFLRCGFEIVRNEWDGLDQWRVDKTYSLIRRLVQTTLLNVRNVIENDGIEEEMKNTLVEEGLDCILQSLLGIPAGVAYHTADCVPEETKKLFEGDDEISDNAVRSFPRLLDSIHKSFATKNQTLFRRCMESYRLHVLDFKFLEQTGEEIAKKLMAIAGSSTGVMGRNRKAIYSLRRAVLDACSPRMEENSESEEEELESNRSKRVADEQRVKGSPNIAQKPKKKTKTVSDSDDSDSDDAVEIPKKKKSRKSSTTTKYSPFNDTRSFPLSEQKSSKGATEAGHSDDDETIDLSNVEGDASVSNVTPFATSKRTSRRVSK